MSSNNAMNQSEQKLLDFWNIQNLDPKTKTEYFYSKMATKV